jgi:hypothetical protein
MTDQLFDYLAPENHVEKRAGLSATLKAQLQEPLDANTQYHGEAAFWLQIHQGLLKTSATLPNWCERFLAEKTTDRLYLMAPRICNLATQLVQHAHGHHHIEDDHFFPVFLRAFPQLANPIDLLEKDHEILSVVLDDIENATKELSHVSQNATSQITTAEKSDLFTKTEQLQKAASRLDRLFIRHIGDEEEICLPTLMRM